MKLVQQGSGNEERVVSNKEWRICVWL